MEFSWISHNILGMSSSQLTNSPSFFQSGEKPPSSSWWCHVCPYLGWDGKANGPSLTKRALLYIDVGKTMSFLPPMWEWFIIYICTTHFWWFGRWFIIVLPTLLYSHVYQWRRLVVSFCLLCNDPCWRSHNLSFHLSLLWLSLSLMLNMTRICRSHGKVWPISILGNRFWQHRI